VKMDSQLNNEEPLSCHSTPVQLEVHNCGVLQVLTDRDCRENEYFLCVNMLDRQNKELTPRI
jgi:hypothetical protein